MAIIIEPFRIKSVEPIRFTTFEQRKQILADSFYNLFLIKSDDVLIDLLTDSGTGAMSSKQWASIMLGDESYAGSPSYYKFESVMKKITGFKHIIPTHQGRAAEKIIYSILGGKGKYFVSNTFFDTTRGNIEYTGAEAYDFLTEEGKIPHVEAPFKGNIDLLSLEKFILEKGPENIPLCVMTITNNSGGGQPVSMQNMKETAEMCKKYGILFFLDACRFAENACFIKMREPGYENKSILEIAQECFQLAVGGTMSAKKDALVNIGGWLALNDDELAQQARNMLIMTEGFPTYGGLAGRDLEAMAQGLIEGMDEDYLKYRLRSIEYMGEKLTAVGIPIIRPTGGHALYIDAKSFLSHIPPHHLPGVALANELYLLGGIRGVEIGSLMFGKYNDNKTPIAPPMELVRLAIPRRVYTQTHIDYVIEKIIEVYENRGNLRGYEIIYESPLLRHFTARLKPL
jgi:tryptophanase